MKENTGLIKDTFLPPYLTPAKIERLSFISEELAEAICASAKVLRHGYSNYDPTDRSVVFDDEGNAHPDNLSDLEDELGHVLAAIELLVISGDVSNINIHKSKNFKLGTVGRWLHHQKDALK